MCRTKSVWPSKKVWGCVSSHRLLVYHLPISQRFLPEHASDIWWYLFARGADHCHTRTRDQIILRKRGLRLSAAVNFSTRDLWLPVCMAYIWPFRWPKSRQKSACWVLVSWYLLFFLPICWMVGTDLSSSSTRAAAYSLVLILACLVFKRQTLAIVLLCFVTLGIGDSCLGCCSCCGLYWIIYIGVVAAGF